VLGDLGVTLEYVRARVSEIVAPDDPGSVGGQLPFTPGAKKALELSLREALAMGHNHIGTEHLLLGLMREEEGAAASILRDLEIDADTVRNAVRAIVGVPGRGRRRGPLPTWRRRRGVYGALSEARDAALEADNYELARKLLELEIEERQKRVQSEESEPGAL
jgi:ATP-dependent Clp protease ATP-binding subunit ClpA